MKQHHKSERHFALDNVFPGKPRYIAPAPIRTVPTLWQRLCRMLGSKR